MDLQTEDKSNKALTVGTLNVLGDMKSDELTAIHTHLQTQDGVQSRIIADMQKLHESISADGVITANEKQMLKKELFIIESEYPLIITKSEATKKSKTDIEAYKEAFQKLQHYIYSELKVFDSMQTALEIERNTFNAFFAAYYSSRSLLQITQDGSTKFLPSLEVQGDYENQIGTFQGRLYRWTGGKWDLLNAVMPLNPVCHYDMADIYNQEKIVYAIEKSISVNKNPTIINAQIHQAYKKAAYYRIHCEAMYTGNANPCIFVYRIDWKAGFIPLNSYIDGKQDFYFFIPEQGFDFYTGIWMQGSVGYTPKPDDSVTVYKFTVTEITNSTLIDSSGNKNHMEFVRGTTLFPKRLGTINGASFERNTYAQCKNPLNTNDWSISMWIAPECMNDRFHHLFNIHNFKPFIYKYGFNSFSTKPLLWTLEPCKLYHFVFTVSKNEIRVFLNMLLIGSIKPSEVEIRKEELLVLGSWKDDYGFYNGFMGQVLLFDRALTEQEILYLYLNPQYPVKNYTLADWAIDPDNPDSSIKNLTPKYLGVTETVPTTRTAVIMKGDKLGAQDANPGDWVLMAKTVGGWKVGVCYRWTGSMWINLEPEYNYTEQYQAALYHICEIPELMKNTGHFGALFAKAIIAQEAFINKLSGDIAFLKKLVVKKLHIDSDSNSNEDFEVDINESVGISVRYKNEPVFEVSKNGRALFSGDIKTPSFELKQGNINSYDLDVSGQYVAETVPNITFSNGKKLPFIGYIKCSGTFDSKNVIAVASYIRDNTKTYKDVIIWNDKRTRGASTYCKGDITYTSKDYEIIIYCSDGTFTKLHDKIVQSGTAINEEEKQRIEYFLTQENYNSYNAFSPPAEDYKPKTKISTMKITINDKATTMKVINLPNGDGSYETGSIYVENGFLKIHL